GAQGGAVVLEPRPFGIWHVRPLQMGDPLADAASRFVRAAFAQLPGRPFGGSIKVVDASGARTAAVRVEGDGTWEMTSGPAGEEPAPSPITPDPTFAVLARAVALPRGRPLTAPAAPPRGRRTRCARRRCAPGAPRSTRRAPWSSRAATAPSR